MGVLLFGEIADTFPPNFDKILTKLKEKPDVSANEHLFLAVLYNVLEAGFLLCHEHFDSFESYGFNACALKRVSELSLNDIYHTVAKENCALWCTKLRTGPSRGVVVNVIGDPSVNSISQFLTVTMYLNHPECVASICLKTTDYVKKTKEGTFMFKDQRKFSLLIKNTLAVPVRENIMIYQSPGCLPHLQRLPVHIVNMIYRNLPCSQKNLHVALHKDTPMKRLRED